MNMVALIPARGGSKRIPRKNVRLLNGHPLMAYTIHAARTSGIFSKVIVSSEDEDTLAIAEAYGAESWLRCAGYAADDAPDALWVREILHGAGLRWWAETPQAFAILRPTSPFRTAETIRRAYQQFRRSEVHSIRAVELAAQHPGKMWFCNGKGYPLTPVCDAHRSDGTPWHSAPTQTLPPVYVQNASLEMAWTYIVTSFGTISGKKIAPFFTEGYEGVDLNTEDDWREAERLIADGRVTLPDLTPAGVQG